MDGLMIEVGKQQAWNQPFSKNYLTDLSVAFLPRRRADYCCQKKESGDQTATAYRSHLPILNERRTLKANIALLKINVKTNKSDSQ